MLEIIAKNIGDILILNKSDADQIEFCVDLKVGGLSPSVEDVKKASEISEKPLNIMLRFHYDNFNLTNKQFKELKRYIINTRNMNFNGYVFGSLNQKGRVEIKKLKKLIKISKGKKFTFHKAFDFSSNPIEDYKILTNLKSIQYVLTSDKNNDPISNINLLKKLASIYSNKLLIGGGVTKNVISHFKKENVLSHFHVGSNARENGKISVDKIKDLK